MLLKPVQKGEWQDLWSLCFTISTQKTVVLDASRKGGPSGEFLSPFLRSRVLRGRVSTPAADRAGHARQRPSLSHTPPHQHDFPLAFLPISFWQTQILYCPLQYCCISFDACCSECERNCYPRFNDQAHLTKLPETKM